VFPYYAVLLWTVLSAPYFVVKDKHGLHEEMGSDGRYVLNDVTLVKPRDEAWSADFL